VSDTATITIGSTIGHWRVATVNARAATCQCRCGAVRVLSVASLIDGTAAPSCGCAPLTSPQLEALREETEQHQRRRDLKDWRPGGRT
jgi:hypothetical protein